MRTHTSKAEHKTDSAAVTQKKTDSGKGTYLQDNRAATIQKKAQNNTGLPDNLKSGIESLSGYSMDDVKVHLNSDKPAQLNAHAFAQGTDIHVASGQEKHLPHEAWHVVQQKQGRVKPGTKSTKKVSINDDKHLETEADIMGEKAIQQKSYARNPAINSSAGSASKTIQPKWIESDKEKILKWDAVLSGTQWYYNTETGWQYYEKGGIVSEEKSYLDWLKAGVQGIKDRDLQADAKKETIGINPRKETPEEAFFKMRNEGMALFAGLNPGGGHGGHDQIWAEQYAKTTEFDKEDHMSHVSVKTGWKNTYFIRMRDHKALGRYQNDFNLETGSITAADNHRDPKEPLNNNEIIYYQLATISKQYGQDLKAKALIRKNIINATLEPLLRGKKGAFTCTPDNENSDLFFTLLTTPNIKVAIHMINDRGRLLKIRSISRLVVDGKNVYIYFE